MTTTSSALDAYEAFIREKVEIEMWTHTQVSEALKKEMHAHSRGFSERSVLRFCQRHGIHKTSRIEDSKLDEAVTRATGMVRPDL